MDGSGSAGSSEWSEQCAAIKLKYKAVIQIKGWIRWRTAKNVRTKVVRNLKKLFMRRETGTESVPCQDAEGVVGEELIINESSPPETVPSPRQA